MGLMQLAKRQSVIQHEGIGDCTQELNYTVTHFYIPPFLSLPFLFFMPWMLEEKDKKRD